MIGRRITAVCCMLVAIALLTVALVGVASAGEYCQRVPEIDPQSMSAGLAVLGGAAAMLLEGYRRRKQQ
jgi:hypothetical protein